MHLDYDVDTILWKIRQPATLYNLRTHNNIALLGHHHCNVHNVRWIATVPLKERD